MSTNGIVRLNVGGVQFLTTRDTLTSHGLCFFTGLLSGHIPSMLDDTGAIFIDRNGKVFQAILDYLRTDQLEVPPGCSETMIRREADFYQISLPPTDEWTGDFAIKASAPKPLRESGFAVARILCISSPQFGYSCPGVEAFALSPSLQRMAAVCPRPPFGTLANVLEQMERVGFCVVHMTTDFVCWKLIEDKLPVQNTHK